MSTLIEVLSGFEGKAYFVRVGSFSEFAFLSPA